ncbi:MAG: hypothetical protein M1815_001160 [Lichina confinis]|nr:MAG: hypothetical protein M1815_001160 [Lichina confinis]
MTSSHLKAKRKARGIDDSKSSRHPKRLKKQTNYESDGSAESEEGPLDVDHAEARIHGAPRPHTKDINGKAGGSEDGDRSEDDSPATDEPATSGDESSDSEASTNAPSSVARKRRKRDDPDVFATTLSKILNSKLSTSKRADPVLARSKVANEANQELADARLEAKARQRLRNEKKVQLDKGRVKDVLGVGTDGGQGSAAETVELERRLKKVAQRGVIKLFNAVRAAQVKGERAAQEAKKQGVVSFKDREAKVMEMSKKGFLDLIAQGGTREKMSVGKTNR